MSKQSGWLLTLPYSEFIVLMSMLMALTALSIDAMLPANPQITAQFGISQPSDLQLIVNIFFLGFALSQLFYGPLADHFGRKPILIAGISIYLFGCLLAAFATSYETLIIARFIQGLGSGAPRVIPTSIIRDLTKGREMAKLMSLTMMIFIIVPILAPTVGELILLFGSWQWIFLMLMLFGLTLVIWLTFRLPETLTKDNHQSLSIKSLTQNFKTILSNPVTMGYTLAVSFMFGAFNIYLSTSQPIFDQFYGLADQFALIFGFIAVFMGLASYLNSQLVVKMGMRKLSQIGLMCFIGVSMILVIVCWLFNGIPPAGLFIGFMSILLFLISLIFPNQHSLAMEPMGKLAGTAASLIGCISTVIGVLLGSFAGYWLKNSVTPMAIAFLAYSCISFAFASYVNKFHLNESS